MKNGIKNHSMLCGGGSLVPVAPATFGNENPAIAYISRRTDLSGARYCGKWSRETLQICIEMSQMQKGFESAIALFLAMKEEELSSQWFCYFL